MRPKHLGTPIWRLEFHGSQRIDPLLIAAPGIRAAIDLAHRYLDKGQFVPQPIEVKMVGKLDFLYHNALMEGETDASPRET